MSDQIDQPSEGGRPPFKVTAALRKRVSIAKGGGMSHEQIAAGLGICRNTLEKHFEAELNAGAQKRRLEIYEAMFRAAKDGNVAAQKAYIAAGDPANAAPITPPTKQPAEEGGGEKVGKKEQAERDATTAAIGTGWGPILNMPLQ